MLFDSAEVGNGPQIYALKMGALEFCVGIHLCLALSRLLLKACLHVVHTKGKWLVMLHTHCC